MVCFKSSAEVLYDGFFLARRRLRTVVEFVMTFCTAHLSGLVKCELRVASSELRAASYELRVAPVLRVASCELVVKSASWYI